MGYMFGFFLIAAIITSTVAVLVSFPPARIAGVLRLTIPILMIGAGGILTIIGRGALGLPLAVVGVTWLARARRMGSFGTSTPTGGTSTVRSAWFEMELDHDSGDLDGIVLTGRLEGRRLSQLSPVQLHALYAEAVSDAESAQLLEAYLDRRMPGWREDAQADAGSRKGGAPGSGPMTKEEAYQVLGLGPGASPKDIHEAHRRLMKRVHPDSGGSTFLAAKINEAKDVLLN